MAGAQFATPLIVVIPGQLITATLWNNEFQNISTNLNPSGLDGYSDTDAQMQIQTAPYPGSVTSHASSLGGEIERIRYQLSQILGATSPAYWYAKPTIDLKTLSNISAPLGCVVEYPSATPPNNNYLLANGQAIPRSTYATLFSLIGTTFGTGDGSTTFNLPNYTDRMSIAAGNIYALGATGGATATTPSVSITDPGHLHTQPSHQHLLPIFSNAGESQSFVQQAGSDIYGFLGGQSLSITNSMSFASNAGTLTAANVAQSSSAGNDNTSSTTTGITASSTSVPTIPPYLGMYKMMRVL